MAEKLLPIIYSGRAIANSLTIKDFILVKFTQKEVDNFYKMLATFEKVVAAFPDIYPKSTINPKSRRAVLANSYPFFIWFIKIRFPL